MIGRAFVLWLLIAVAEILHGIARVALLNRRVGDRRARQIGVFTGSALILLITWAAVPWLGVGSTRDCFAVGALWLVLMILFEIAFGRLIFRASWKRIVADFDFRQGGLLAIGMLVLFFAPVLTARLRGLV